MKQMFFTFNILAFLLLAACQGAKETIVEKHYIPNGEYNLPLPPSQNHGGADPGGGGNGVEEKLLESFRVDLLRQEVFLRLKGNVIDKLLASFPKLAADLQHIAEERAWYLIPTELKELPAAKIGVSFKTDQIALQKLKEVWINDLIFSKMSPRDQEILILHELIMGVRLLEFANLLDQCLVNIAPLKLDPDNIEKYKAARRDCFKKHRNAAEIGDSIGLGKDIKLHDFDYETIRDITNTLMTKIDSLDPQELEDYMVARNFRKYAP